VKMVSYEKHQSGSQQSIISRLSGSFFITGHRVLLGFNEVKYILYFNFHTRWYYSFCRKIL